MEVLSIFKVMRLINSACADLRKISYLLGNSRVDPFILKYSDTSGFVSVRTVIWRIQIKPPRKGLRVHNDDFQSRWCPKLVRDLSELVNKY